MAKARTKKVTKMGRPEIPAEERRSKAIRFRVSELQSEAIRVAAEEAGATVSTYVLNAVLARLEAGS